MCSKRIADWCGKKREWYKEHKPLAKFIVLIIIVPVLIIGASFFCAFPPPSVVVEQQKLNVSLSPGKNYTETISIRANEEGEVYVTLSGFDKINEWVSSKKSVSVDVGRRYYIDVVFEIPKNATPGKYKGELSFSWEIVSGKDSERLRRIPIILKINPLGNNS